MSFSLQLRDSDDDFLLRLRERSGLGLVGGLQLGGASSVLADFQGNAVAPDEQHDWGWSSRVLDKAKSALQDWNSEGEDDFRRTCSGGPQSGRRATDDNNDSESFVDSRVSLTLSHSTAAATSPRACHPHRQSRCSWERECGGVDDPTASLVSSSTSSSVALPASRWQQLRGQAYEALAGEREGLSLTNVRPRSAASQCRRSRPRSSSPAARKTGGSVVAGSRGKAGGKRNAAANATLHTHSTSRTTSSPVVGEQGASRSRTVTQRSGVVGSTLQPQLLELHVTSSHDDASSGVDIAERRQRSSVSCSPSKNALVAGSPTKRGRSASRAESNSGAADELENCPTAVRCASPTRHQSQAAAKGSVNRSITPTTRESVKGSGSAAASCTTHQGDALPGGMRRETNEGLSFRRLRGSSARVYYFGEGSTAGVLPHRQRQSAANDEHASKTSPNGSGEEAGGQDRLEEQVEDCWEFVQRVMSVWRAAVASTRAETGKMSRWLEWRRHLRCWKAWRYVVVSEAAERAAQSMLIERKKADIASRFHRAWVLHRALTSWRTTASLEQAARAQAEKEEAERIAYEADMERIRKMYAAKAEVAQKFSCTYICHRAVAAWQRGVRASKQEAAMEAQREAARSRIQAVIAAKKAKVAASSSSEVANSSTTVEDSPPHLTSDCQPTTKQEQALSHSEEKRVECVPDPTQCSDVTTVERGSVHHPSCDSAASVRQQRQYSACSPSAGSAAVSSPNLGSSRRSSGSTSSEPAGGNGQVSLPITAYGDGGEAICTSSAPHDGRNDEAAVERVAPVRQSPPTLEQMKPEQVKGGGEASTAVAEEGRVGQHVVVSGSSKGGRKSCHHSGVAGMEARAKERAQRRAALASKYSEQQRAAEEEHMQRCAAEEAAKEAERERQRRVALARREEAKKAAEARHAVHRLAERQTYLAGLHYSLSLLRRVGWVPWLKVMERVKVQRWRASECHRRRVLATAMAAWWSPAEASLAAQWRMAVAAERFYHVHATGRVFSAWFQWCAAVRAGDRVVLSGGFAAFKMAAWLARQLERRRVEFRWEQLAGCHFRAWKSVWRDSMHAKLVAESKIEAIAWKHAMVATRVRCMRAWKQALRESRDERRREERRAQAWSKINGWLDCSTRKANDNDVVPVLSVAPTHIEGIYGGRQTEDFNVVDASSALLRRRTDLTKGGEATKSASAAPTSVGTTERREMVARLMRATNEHAASDCRRRSRSSTNDFLAVLPPPPPRQL